jgi:hypothetical protein
MRKPIKVAEFIEKGELSGTEKDSEEILATCADLLDDSCTHEIVGPVLFRDRDGRYYTVTVEAIVSRASKDFIKNTLAEKKAEAEGQVRSCQGETPKGQCP